MTAVPPRRAAETSTVTAEITFPDLNNGQVASLIIAVGDVPVASAACTATRTQEAWVGVNINSTSWGAVHQIAPWTHRATPGRRDLATGALVTFGLGATVVG
jgi:hypothetical protein